MYLWNLQHVPKSKEKNWHVVIATKPRDLFRLEDDVVLEVKVLQVENSTLNEPFANAIARDNDMKIDSNNSGTESMKIMRHYMVLILTNLYVKQ